jgi:hypothetical protein
LVKDRHRDEDLLCYCKLRFTDTEEQIFPAAVSKQIPVTAETG